MDKKHIFILVFLTNALLSSNCSKILNLTVLLLAGGIVSLIDVLKYTLK